MVMRSLTWPLLSLCCMGIELWMSGGHFSGRYCFNQDLLLLKVAFLVNLHIFCDIGKLDCDCLSLFKGSISLSEDFFSFFFFFCTYVFVTKTFHMSSAGATIRRTRWLPRVQGQNGRRAKKGAKMTKEGWKIYQKL